MSGIVDLILRQTDKLRIYNDGPEKSLEYVEISLFSVQCSSCLRVPGMMYTIAVSPVTSD